MARTPTRKPRTNGVGVVDTRITVPLPKDVDERLRAYACQQDRSVAGLIREWIVEKLQEADEKRSRRVRMGAARSI